MHNKLLFGLASLTLALSAQAQTAPSVVTYERDTICSDNYGFGIYNLVVEDPDNDSTYITIDSYDMGLIGYAYVVEPATYDSGSSTRTFKIDIYANPSIPAGVTLTDMNITVYDGGLSTSVTLTDIGVRLGPTITSNLSSTVFCSNANPEDPALYVSPVGGTFVYFSGDELPYFDPEVYALNPGDGVVYEYTDEFGCYASLLDYITTSNAPSISVIENSSSCGNADGSAVASITGDALPFDVYWSNGFSETVTSASILNNLSSGNYYINVVDANGCKAFAEAQISDGDLDITETVTNENCKGQTFDGAIDLNVLSTNGTVDYIFWNTGETTEDISGLTYGEYTVHVHTSTNCQAFYTVLVDAYPALEVSLDNILPADCSASDGGNSAIEITTYGGSGNYAWAWSHGATSEDVYNLVPGIYTCTVTDQITGCSWAWSKVMESFNGPVIGINDVTPSTCNEADGAIDVSIWAPNPIISTSWNTGHLTEDLTNVPAGTYIISVMDIAGCVGQQQVKLGTVKPYQPSICLLTVDSTLVYNTVIWEKDLSQNVSGFNVYRETDTYGVFEQVAHRPYGLESLYQDNIASPMDRSWRYYLTTFDDCGNESFPSFIHKTIHVVANTSDGINYTLSWDNYEGISYSSIDLHRFDATNGWVTVDNLPYGTNTYADAPPVTAGLDYMVTFNLTNDCSVTKAQDYNSSRSNKTASVFMPGGSTAQIIDNEVGTIILYPNPASEQVTIHLDKPELFVSYRILNVNGQEVMSDVITASNTALNIEEIPAGVYFIQLISSEKLVTLKLIIE